MSGKRRQGGTLAAVAGNYCFLFGLGMRTSQTAVPETTEYAQVCKQGLVTVTLTTAPVSSTSASPKVLRDINLLRN